MKKLLVLLALAALTTTTVVSTASAGLPGAYHQQERSGYPQSPPGGS